LTNFPSIPGIDRLEVGVVGCDSLSHTTSRMRVSMSVEEAREFVRDLSTSIKAGVSIRSLMRKTLRSVSFEIDLEADSWLEHTRQRRAAEVWRSDPWGFDVREHASVLYPYIGDSTTAQITGTLFLQTAPQELLRNADLPAFRRKPLELDLLFARLNVFDALEAAMTRWSRRHDASRSSGRTYRKSRAQGGNVFRRLIALLRFVAGFFGSHKVDARNNP